MTDSAVRIQQLLRLNKLLNDRLEAHHKAGGHDPFACDICLDADSRGDE